MIDPSLIYCSICYRSRLEQENQTLLFYVSSCARILCNDCQQQQQSLQNIVCTKCSRTNCQKELISDQLNPNVRGFFMQNANENCQHKQIVRFQQSQLKSFEQHLRQQLIEHCQRWNNNDGQNMRQLKSIENERIKRLIELKNTIDVYKRQKKQQHEFNIASNYNYRNHNQRPETLKIHDDHHNHHYRPSLHHHSSNLNHHQRQSNSFETSLILQTSSSNSMIRALNVSSRSSSSTLKSNNPNPNKLFPMTNKSTISKLPSLSSYTNKMNLFNLGTTNLKTNTIHDRLYRKASPSIYSAMSSVYRHKINPYAASRL